MTGTVSRHEGSLQIGLPVVSIIITNYNYERYVKDALLSAIGQSYPNIEILIVDDASTDQSWNIINEFIGSNDATVTSVKALRMESSVGQTGAAACGFAASRGSYIVLLDADDILMPRCIETHIYSHLSSRLAVGFSSVDCVIIRDAEIIGGKGSRETADFIASRKGQMPDFVCPINETLAGTWLSQQEPPVTRDQIHFVLPPQCEPWVWSYMSGHCFRRDALHFFLRGPLEGLKTGTDGFLVKAISAMCGSMVIDQKLMGYRVHGKNAFTTSVPLMNMSSYGTTQINRILAVDKMSINQMIENAEVFSHACEEPRVFFEALESLCRSWPLKSEFGDSDYFSKTLETNSQKLIKFFGKEQVKYWVQQAYSKETPARQPSIISRLLSKFRP